MSRHELPAVQCTGIVLLLVKGIAVEHTRAHNVTVAQMVSWIKAVCMPVGQQGARADVSNSTLCTPERPLTRAPHDQELQLASPATSPPKNGLFKQRQQG